MPPIPNNNNSTVKKLEMDISYSSPGSSSSSLTDSSCSASSTPTSLNKKFKADTIFVFDYDDTLLCSSHLCQFDLRLGRKRMNEKKKKN